MRNRKGFALISALWLVVVISVAGLQLALESRETRLRSINVAHNSRARAAAQAALDLTRARLDLALRRAAENGPVDTRLRLADAWLDIDSIYSRTESVAGVDVHISVRPTGSYLNINRASEEEFINFFVGMQVDYSWAETLAQCIMDWRDTDDEYRARGAERDFYMRRGMLALPRNNQFESVEELRYVEGMTEDLFEVIRPYLTTWGNGRINVNTADEVVLRGISGFNENAIYYVLSTRSNGQRIADFDELNSYLSNGSDALSNANRTRLQRRIATDVDELEISALATTDDGRPIVRMLGLIRRGTNVSTLTTWRVE